MNFLKTIGMASFLASCGQLDDDGKGFFAKRGDAGKSFASDCLQNDGWSRRRVIRFESGSFSRRTYNFSTGDCQKDSLESIYEIYYNAPQKEVRGDLEGWETLVCNVGLIQLTPKTVYRARSYSKHKTYGYDGWQTNQPYQVNGKKWEEDSEHSEYEFGAIVTLTIKRDGKKLMVASYASGDASEVGGTVYSQEQQ